VIGEELHVPEDVRSAVITRIERYGIEPIRLGAELLMREGWGTFEDFLADIDARYGADEGQRVRETMKRQVDRDQKTQDLGGRQGLDQLARARWMTANMSRYALIAAPDAAFLNGVQIALDLVADEAAEPGTARESEVKDEVGRRIDELFAKRGVPYRYEDGQLVWAGDAGANRVVVAPALQALGDERLAGARSEFEPALGHLRLGTLKDLEDAIEEAAKSVESAMSVLIAETGTALTAAATAQNMFNALKTAGIVPAYTETALLGAARIRNKLGGHGAGATPRRIDLDEATMTVNAAAVALVFLAGRLP